jgi:hypothetical protein
MHALVHNEMAFRCTSIIAFVARVWTFNTTQYTTHTSAGGSWHSSTDGHRISVMHLLTRCILDSGQFSTLGIGYFLVSIARGYSFTAHFLCQRSLDGAQNQILPRPQIARELGLERQTNAARRQLLARADGGADESGDSRVENIARNRGVG